MDCVIYNRCSTSKQDLTLNTEKCKHWINKAGHNLIKIFEDFAVSGKNLNRTGIQELISECHGNRFKIIVVADTSRLSRSTRDMLNLLHNITQLGKKVYFVEEGELFDPDDEDSMLKLSLWSIFNERERKRIKKRLDEGLKRAKALGHKPGRKKREISCTDEELLRMIKDGLTRWQIMKNVKIQTTDKKGWKRIPYSTLKDRINKLLGE